MIELTTVAFDASAGEATLDAIVLFTVLLLLACHGMARGWPAQLGEPRHIPAQSQSPRAAEPNEEES